MFEGTTSNRSVPTRAARHNTTLAGGAPVAPVLASAADYVDTGAAAGVCYAGVVQVIEHSTCVTPSETNRNIVWVLRFFCVLCICEIKGRKKTRKKDLAWTLQSPKIAKKRDPACNTKKDSEKLPNMMQKRKSSTSQTKHFA